MFFVYANLFFQLMCVSLVRIVFFCSMLMDWNSASGESRHRAYLFYLTDGIAAVLFFNLVLVLSMFWAELYHISTGSEILYQHIIRPSIYLSNIGAYLILLGCYFYVEFSFSSIKYYFYDENVVALCVLYTCGILILFVYSQLAAMEIKAAPIKLSVRRERINSLTILCASFIMALISRVVISFVFYNKDINSNLLGTQFYIMSYFLCLEIVPLLVALWFYHIILPDKFSADSINSGTTESSAILLPPGHPHPPMPNYHTASPYKSMINSTLGFGSISRDGLLSSHSSSSSMVSDVLVNQLIDRLSDNTSQVTNVPMAMDEEEGKGGGGDGEEGER